MVISKTAGIHFDKFERQERGDSQVALFVRGLFDGYFADGRREDAKRSSRRSTY